MSPFKIVQHEPGPEPNRVPLAQVMVDPFGVFQKGLIITVELAIVIQIVNSNLESAPSEV
jgi:hypothetical protein